MVRWVLTSICLLVASATGAHAAPAYGVPSADSRWSIQLHTHGPLSESSGSVEWHHGKARAIGVDAIWWTDHDWRVTHWSHTTGYDFENCVWDAANNRFAEPDEDSPGDERFWERYTFLPPFHRKAVVDSVASEGTQSLLLGVDNLQGTAFFQTLDLRQTGTRKQNMYCLANGVKVRFSLLPETLDPATDKFVLYLRLSERETEWHELRYVIGSMHEEDVDAIPLTWVPGQWNTYELDVTADAKTLFSTGGLDTLRGEDNSLFELRIQLSSRLGGSPVVFLDDLQYIVDPGVTGDDLLAWMQDLGAYYESQEPGTSHLVGSEISRYRSQPHMNAYVPGAPFLVDYTGTGWPDSLYYAVDQVHAQGGIVSYNHPWGPGVYGDLNETEQQKAARILLMKGDQLATNLYGCDLLEVGYRWRHGIQLAGHLDLWDTLNGNRRFVTGIGTSDTHGSTPFYGWAPWLASATFENNFVTWFWAPSLSEPDVIHALDSGRAYFGDPYLWQGDLDLQTLDGFPMGRVVVTDQPTHDVQLRVDNVSPTSKVRFLQIEIRDTPAYHYPHILRDETFAATVVGDVYTDTVTVDTTTPSFVRIELSDSGEPWAFSNPIHFLDAVPPDGVDARRAAVRLEDVRLLSAQGLVLRDAQLVLSPEELVLSVDEDVPGLGQMVVDPGARGAPSGVLGATTWNFDGSVLTLGGFSGTGSTVRVLWGAVSVKDDRAAIREVALTAGRPNPFGNGFVAELALPEPAQVLVEVLDVRGRRLRILLDERRDAGRHRLAWDGNDPYGRPAADGVYFLRMSALGRTLTAKAVKIR
ncbi:MAG: hypothetical protein DHS20C21_17490 [Gemmatimonadota bacterium]|nr:MAG: hypothetical protein DHS20C21_17490 [Gemmatimonadota bacterium]